MFNVILEYIIRVRWVITRTLKKYIYRICKNKIKTLLADNRVLRSENKLLWKLSKIQRDGRGNKGRQQYSLIRNTNIEWNLKQTYTVFIFFRNVDWWRSIWFFFCFRILKCILVTIFGKKRQERKKKYGKFLEKII